MNRLKVEKRGRHEYWIVGLAPYEVNGEVFTSCGPFTSRAEAIASRDSMEAVLSDLEEQ